MNKKECQICHGTTHETANCIKIDKREEKLKEKKEKLETIQEVLEEDKKTIERLEQEKEERIIRDKNYSAEIANNRFICYYCLKKLSCQEMLACILNDEEGKMHCGQVFKNLEEFIKHLENCSNIPHSKIHTSIIQRCEKCKKIIVESDYFEQDLPHDCQSEQKEEKKVIEKYIKENNIKNIRLLSNGELEIEYNDGNIKITKPNEPILSQIKNKMIRDGQQIINQEQLQENNLSNKFTSSKSLIIFIGVGELKGLYVFDIKPLTLEQIKNIENSCFLCPNNASDDNYVIPNASSRQTRHTNGKFDRPLVTDHIMERTNESNIGLAELAIFVMPQDNGVDSKIPCQETAFIPEEYLTENFNTNHYLSNHGRYLVKILGEEAGEVKGINVNKSLSYYNDILTVNINEGSTIIAAVSIGIAVGSGGVTTVGALGATARAGKINWHIFNDYFPLHNDETVQLIPNIGSFGASGINLFGDLNGWVKLSDKCAINSANRVIDFLRKNKVFIYSENPPEKKYLNLGSYSYEPIPTQKFKPSSITITPQMRQGINPLNNWGGKPPSSNFGSGGNPPPMPNLTVKAPIYQPTEQVSGFLQPKQLRREGITAPVHSNIPTIKKDPLNTSDLRERQQERIRLQQQEAQRQQLKPKIREGFTTQTQQTPAEQTFIPDIPEETIETTKERKKITE
ncbi:11269_t:CDS:2 [Funneliformis geosporum]|uniref:11269_t:CDS:1 n=1 Tax=Funneliformis geosporum TaxID=1117311 RepID=A0A9W4T1I2_9GLOM|nr:11269_t:CDS:2 [Funneliformis geosporum]